MVDRLKQEYEGRVEFRLVNVDTDPEGEQLMARFRAQGVPAFAFINTDGSTASVLIGARDESELRQSLDALQ